MYQKKKKDSQNWILSENRLEALTEKSKKIYGALRDSVPSAQFKKRKTRVLLLLKVIFIHGCFSSFLNCTNGTKSRKAPHISFEKNKFQGKLVRRKSLRQKNLIGKF